jgi:hypothetical protein
MPLGPSSYNAGKQLEIQLGPERAAELKSLLLQGKPVRELVPIVQNEWKLFEDKKPGTVQTMLYRYSRGVVKQEAVARVLAAASSSKHVRVTSLEELQDLCEKQKRRLGRALELEEKMNGVLTDQATNQIRLLSDMLKNLALLQLETGLLPRAPKTVKGMMMGGDGQITQFGWVENDDALLDQLTQQTQVTDDHHDEPGFAD